MKIKIGLLFFFGSLLINACDGDQKPKKLEKVTLGSPIAIITSLIWLAEANKYFKEEGLDLSIKIYPSGKKSMMGMFRNEVELSVSAEVPFVFFSFDRNDITLIATLGTSNNENKILARKDFGIYKPSNLKGLKIGAQKGAAAHFFLHTFLQEHYLLDSVKIVYQKIQTLPKSLAKGEIHAFCSRSHFVQIGKRMLGEKAIVFESPGLYRKTFNLITTKNYAKKNPGVLIKVMRAILKAEKFLKNNPEKSINILAKRSGRKRKLIQFLWKDFKLGISLKQSLILSMENEARWIINTGLRQRKNIPDYYDSINFNTLEKLSPEKINIIGYNYEN